MRSMLLLLLTTGHPRVGAHTHPLRSGRQAGTDGDAATRIQACARGMMWRARTRAHVNSELVFLGMRARVRAPLPQTQADAKSSATPWPGDRRPAKLSGTTS